MTLLMLLNGYSIRRTLSGFAIAGCLLVGLPVVALAQGLPGVTLFSGVKAENRLNYRLDFGGNTDGWDRYRLRVPKAKMKVAVAQFAIDYPDYYKGKFDPKSVEVMVNNKPIALQEVKWQEKDSLIEIFPKEPVPAGADIELVLSNVKNPSNGGIFYFECKVISPGDVPLFRELGTWEITIQ